MKHPLTIAGAFALPLLAATAFAADPAAMDDAARMNYALGYQLGRDLAAIEPSNDALLRGLQDGRSGGQPALAEQDMQAALTMLESRINEQRAKEQSAAAQKAAGAGALTSKAMMETSRLGQPASDPGSSTALNAVQCMVQAGAGPPTEIPSEAAS